MASTTIQSDNLAAGGSPILDPRAWVTLLLVGDEGGGQFAAGLLLSQGIQKPAPPRVVCMCDGRMAQALKDRMVEVILLGQRGPKIIAQPGQLRRIRGAFMWLHNLLWLMLRAWQFARLQKRSGTAVVHTNPGYPALAAILAHRFGARFALICHWRGVGLRNMAKFVPQLTRHVDRFIAISNAVRASLPRPWQLKTDVVHRSVPVSDLAKRAEESSGRLRDILEVDESVPILVMVGTYAEHKGQDCLVEAMMVVHASHPSVHCAIIGETTGIASEDYYRQLLERTSALNLSHRIHLLRDVSRPAECFVDATIAVLPSRGVGEGFGLVFIEAMACNAPVVAFDCGAASEVIENNVTGILAPNENIEALGNAIVSLLDAPDRATEMGRRGRERAGLFDARGELTRIEDIYLRELDREA